MAHLRLAAEADLDPEKDGTIAERLKEAMRAMWKTACVNERIVPEEGPPIIVGGSLISRVQDEGPAHLKTFTDDKIKIRPRWVQIHKPYNAWFRPAWYEGEAVIRLGMHFDLARQVRITWPVVSCQRSFTDLGERLGLLDRDPKITTRVSGGGRISVLALELSQELLDNPEGWEESPDVNPSDTEGMCH